VYYVHLTDKINRRLGFGLKLTRLQGRTKKKNPCLKKRKNVLAYLGFSFILCYDDPLQKNKKNKKSV
jgi:hypothetical protein